jgi:hypothetical protein
VARRHHRNRHAVWFLSLLLVKSDEVTRDQQAAANCNWRCLEHEDALKAVALEASYHSQKVSIGTE